MPPSEVRMVEPAARATRPDLHVSYKSNDIDKELLSNAADILIQIPYRPTEGINAMLSEYIATWLSWGISVQYIRDQFGGFIELTRNMMAHIFLKTRYKYLLMCDSDVCPVDVRAPLLMARNMNRKDLDVALVSGLACGLKPSKGLFICVAIYDEHGVARFPTETETSMIPGSGLIEIENAGGGFFMVRRDVLETLWSKAYLTQQNDLSGILAEIQKCVSDGTAPDAEMLKKWAPMLEKMQHHQDDDGLPFSIPRSVMTESARLGSLLRSEDICFTDRARRAGFKLYADWAIHCVHEKYIPLRWPQAKIDETLNSAEWRASSDSILVAQV